jgi:hypothetical protein
MLSYYGILKNSVHLSMDWLLVATDTRRTPEVWSRSAGSSVTVQALLHLQQPSGVHWPYVAELVSCCVHLSNCPEYLFVVRLAY